jgi:hypothetical protein
MIRAVCTNIAVNALCRIDWKGGGGGETIQS